MPRPRILRLTSPPTAKPSQTSFLKQNTAPQSHLHPLSTRPLKSPAFFLPFSSHDHQYCPSFPLASPCRFPASQPPSPLTWTWRCHLCYTTYRLGTTRRCLLDGHYFCSTPPPPASPSPPPSPTPTTCTSPTSPTSRTKSIAPLPLAERRAFRAWDTERRKGEGEGEE